MFAPRMTEQGGGVALRIRKELPPGSGRSWGVRGWFAVHRSAESIFPCSAGGLRGPRDYDQQRTRATVSVRGEATIEADPEVVLFAVSVNARARDRREALANLSQRNDAFLELVRSFGQAIEKIETSGISVSPELRRGREEKVRWYRGTIRTRLTVADFTVAGDLVGRVSDMELCVIDGPWWN